MKIAVMQPYFFPYIGYFELIKSVDLFVFLDSQYKKRSWINRNKIRNKNNTFYITIPLKKHSRSSKISQINIEESTNWRKKHLYSFLYCYGKNINNNKIYQNYIELTSGNLYEVLLKTIKATCNILEISSEFEESKNINLETINDINLNTKEKKVISLCKHFNCDEYYNLPGGVEIYSKENFKNHNIKLNFLHTNQFDKLSILNNIFKR